MTTATASGSWIAFRKPNPRARLRLFCFPYAGAGASIFRTWPESLPADVEICPVQLPGRGARLNEIPFARLAPLVDALAEALVPLLERPFAIFGHSVGALVGFELARQLRKRFGIEPVRLFVSAARAPQVPSRHPPMHALPDVDFMAELRHLNGTPNEVLDDAEFMEIMLPILRADIAFHETYVYAAEPPLGCKISSFGGVEDHRVAHDDLEAWRDQTSESFSLRMFAGDHFFVNAAQPLLLQALSQDLYGDGVRLVT